MIPSHRGCFALLALLSLLALHSLHPSPAVAAGICDSDATAVIPIAVTTIGILISVFLSFTARRLSLDQWIPQIKMCTPRCDQQTLTNIEVAQLADRPVVVSQTNLCVFRTTRDLAIDFCVLRYRVWVPLVAQWAIM